MVFPKQSVGNFTARFPLSVLLQDKQVTASSGFSLLISRHWFQTDQRRQMAGTKGCAVRTNYDLDEFDLVLVSAPDIHGIARGRFMFKPSLKGFVKNGLGQAQAAYFSGIMCDIPLGLKDYSKEGWANGTLIPDMSTLRPLSYLSYGDKKVGQLICDFLSLNGEREISMSREVALNQLNTLKHLGYEIFVSYELEFIIFKKGTLTPISLKENLDSFLNEVLTALWESGIAVTTVGKGTEDGKIQIAVEAVKGIDAADSLHRLRNILKSLCMNSGYDITYMTKPLSGYSQNGCHYIMTLVDQKGSNILTCSNHNNNNKLSEVGQQWTAGLLHHHAALTALSRPTLNCYLSEPCDEELSASWMQDRDNSSSWLKIIHNNEGTYIKDCLPTSASNPYAVLGGLIAAGISGISNKLTLPPQNTNEESVQMGPSTLLEALDSLEKDTELSISLGSKFVYRFILLKKEFEVNRLKNKTDDDNIFKFERNIYLNCL
ncbi:hypothetical protein Btru_014163 [Bulinus truncatus]|nr:hypothetical protein Btru_014163 [Bulinus truncatus]